MYRGAAARFGSLCCCTEPLRSGNRVSGRRRRKAPDDARARGATRAGPGLRHGRTGGWRWSRWWRRSSAGLGCPGWRERRGGRGRLARPPAASCDARNTYSDIHRKDPPPELRRNAPNDGKDTIQNVKKQTQNFFFPFPFLLHSCGAGHGERGLFAHARTCRAGGCEGCSFRACTCPHSVFVWVL